MRTPNDRAKLTGLKKKARRGRIRTKATNKGKQEREKLRPNLIYTNTFLFLWEHLIKRK